VESLLKKHNDFGKSLEAQEEKVTALKETADCLAGANHYDTERYCTVCMDITTSEHH
jgi:hypothetical protein